jgi:hypothetical protein
MNSTRVLVPTIIFGAGGLAAPPAGGFDDKSLPIESASPENPQTFTLSRILSRIANSDIIENTTDDHPARDERVTMVRSGAPISTTTQKRPKGRLI